MVKKGKAVTSKKIEMTPLFTDTTCSIEGGTSTSEAMYNIMEEEQLRIMETKVTVDGRDSLDASNARDDMLVFALHSRSTEDNPLY